MKIVQLVFHLGPGGAEKIVVDLSNELSAQGNDVVVVMLRDPREDCYGFNQKFLSPSVRLVSLNIGTGFRPWDIRTVEKCILAEEPDVVHCHLNVIPYIFLLSLRKRDIKFVHTVHSVATFDIAGRFQRKLAKFFYKRTVRPVAISQICQDSFIQEYGIRPDLVYNGRSAQVPGEEAPVARELIAHLPKPVFVHVGRYSEEKNQDMLVEAAQILRNEGQPFSLIFIGKGYEESGLPERNPDRNILFLGTKANVADYLSCCDAFCLPSLIEGCPVSLIEALSCGITPVCTPAGGVPDMIKDGETGYISKDFSPESFADAMKRFIAKPLSPEALAGHFDKHFSISQCASDYMDLYHRPYPDPDTRPGVLFITPLPPPVHGSAMVSDFIRNSRKINEAFKCDYVNLSLSRTVSEIGKTSFNKTGRFISAYFKTLHLLLHNHYDLCCIALTCHGPGFLKDAPFAKLCKLFGVRLLIHQHNKGMAAYVGKWPYNKLLKSVYKDSTVILLSWKLYEDISSVVSKDQVLICHNGIGDLEAGMESKRTDNGTANLLYLSNLIPDKGVPELLKACSILKQKDIPFECHIVGNETQELSRNDLSSSIESLGIEGSVFFDGCKYGKDKEEAFATSDIFVFPTRYPNECFPLVLLEAMQHSLPVVTTDEGGIPDIVTDGENGLICKKNDPESLANALEKLILDPENRRLMGEAGRAKYEAEFTLDTFEDSFIDCIYSSLKKND